MLPSSTLHEQPAVVLSVPEPFDGQSQLEFLGRRAVPGLEIVHDRGYARTLRLPGGPAALRVDLSDGTVRARLWLSSPSDRADGVERCRWLLDLDADAASVDAHLGKDRHLASSVRDHPGLRVPGHVDGFEVAVRAVVGQQISVAGARTIVGRLVAGYGDAVAGPAGLTQLFPTPDTLAAVDPERLPMPRARARALAAVAEAVASGDLVLDRSADRDDVRRSLLALPGIGPWTADYIALRALGDPDVFPGTDLGIRQGMAALGLEGDSGAVEAWRPWRSYASMHVWKSAVRVTP